jgi:hypothetical protein
VDSDCCIVQDVNPKLFASIINHLRLKALRLSVGDVPPIVIATQDRAALENMLIFYGMSDVQVHCVE